MLGSGRRVCAGNFGLQKLVDLANRANLAQVLVFDVDLEHFFNGEHDFEQCQRIEAKVFAEAGTVIRRGDFNRRSGGLVAFENPIDNNRNRLQIAIFTKPDGGVNCHRTATAQSFL